MLSLARLYALVTPQPVQRLEAYRLPDWERQGSCWRVPRSSLTPILRFADIEAFVQDQPAGGPDPTGLSAFIQVAVAKEDQPHYLKILARPGAAIAPLVDFGLAMGPLAVGDLSGLDVLTRFAVPTLPCHVLVFNLGTPTISKVVDIARIVVEEAAVAVTLVVARIILTWVNPAA